ncbi:hypothetical protein ACT91Q_18745 [Brevibacillus thermoruber]|uniref:hypothetical protein n=1 Tax=Brevibacillus thermoruber TaxID=33942 RepID=UPI004041C748
MNRYLIQIYRQPSAGTSNQLTFKVYEEDVHSKKFTIVEHFGIFNPPLERSEVGYSNLAILSPRTSDQIFWYEYFGDFQPGILSEMAMNFLKQTQNFDDQLKLFVSWIEQNRLAERII